MNKSGQIAHGEDLFKAIVTAIIGIIFLLALAPIVGPVIGNSFIMLGVFFLIAAVMITFMSIILKFLNSIQNELGL